MRHWVTLNDFEWVCLAVNEWTGLFGLFSNVFLIAIILAYRPMRERVTNLYLINQSLIDATVATFLFLTTILQDNRRPLTPGHWADEALCRLWFTKMPLWGMLVSSTYSLVSLTFERFLAVVYPLRHRAWCSRRTVSETLHTSVRIMGRLHDPANVQQTSSKCIQNTRADAGRLLEVCWIV